MSTPSTSASPAPFRRRRSAAQHADGASPSKRRNAATPARSLASPSNHSGSTSDPQLDTARRASSSRVLSVWSTLEAKYARRLDEDDIVDLVSGTFYKDRGVLNHKAGIWDIGCFADPKEAQDLAPEDDDEEDEIGRWGSDSELEHQFTPLHIPPACELDPEDAEDLRAFLAAEDARKALHGQDDEFSEDEAGLNDTGGDNHDLQLDTDAETDESILEVEAKSTRLSPTESDDDLAGYDDTVGEGALLWEVSTELSNCSEPLGAEDPMGSLPLHALPRRHQPPAKLCTPPLSRSSMRPPNDQGLPTRSPQPLRPPVNLPSPPISRKASASVSTKKGTSSQYSPDRATKRPMSTDKGKPSLSPTKNLVAEVLLPKRRPRSTSTAPSQHYPQRASASHPFAASLPSREFWPPSSHPAPPALAFPVPGSVLPPPYTRESSLTPHPDAQIYIAQAMQSLSYLAFGAPQPPPTVSLFHQSHAHTPQAFPASSHPPSQWPYPAPYYPHHPHSYASTLPPWTYSPYPYHYPPASHPPPPTPSPSPASGGKPPSSPPDFSSSPLSGKGKRKRVSFPQEVEQSGSASDSSPTRNGSVKPGVSMGMGNWNDKGKTLTSGKVLQRQDGR